MANVNLYATLAEFKTAVTARGQTDSTDVTDDLEIIRLLAAASRYIDGPGVGRKFYPRIATLHYDATVDRELWFNDDLLSLTHLYNGDLTEITSADYTLVPIDTTPHYKLKIKDISSLYWKPNTYNSCEDVITVVGVWGYHEDYAHAWAASGAVLAAAMADTTTLTSTCTTLKLSPGHIIKIDDEILNVTAVTVGTSDSITVFARGDNGSTAATHLINAPVYIWVPDERMKDACIQIAVGKYRRRGGENVSDQSVVTTSGAVISPRDIPSDAYRNMMGLRRLV